MISKDQWKMVLETVSAQQRSDRVQQQALFRVMQAISQKRPSMLAAAAPLVPLDMPFYLRGQKAVPEADSFIPEGYKGDSITPMGWAAAMDDVESLEALENMGADPTAPNTDGRDPLWMAMNARAIGAWNYLMPRVVKWDARTVDGRRTTRLIDAVVMRAVECVEDILRNGVAVNAVDSTGRTALHYNFLQNPYTPEDSEIGRLLVRYGAPTDAADHEGVTPAALATHEDHLMMVERAHLAKVSEQERKFAAEQRAHLEAMQAPLVKPSEIDPTDPGTPQIQKIVRPKRVI